MSHAARSFLPELWKSYPLPLVALLPAFTNSDVLLALFYSIHGGFGWLLIPCALPWVSIRVARLLLAGSPQSAVHRRLRAMQIGLGYVLLSIASSLFLAWRLSPPLELTALSTLSWYYFPLNLLASA